MKWDISDSLEEYQIHRWASDFLSINQEGDLCIHPLGDLKSTPLSIMKIVNEVRSKKVKLPVVLRFHDLLHTQVKKCNDYFFKTIEQSGFQGSYFGVYPIKVNQLREVVEEIVDAGKAYNYGLEAGSKAELLSILAYNDNPKALSILNGYKDKEYLKLACLGKKLGRNIVIVVEKPGELDLALEVMQEMQVECDLGIRAKLNTESSGPWKDSSGDKAKFGLSFHEIYNCIEKLKSHHKEHLFKLLHFHVGSQIPDIRSIKECLLEGARLYAELKKLGLPIEYFDAGGGVGINYGGLKSTTGSSTNYDLKDYVSDVVYILKDVCDQAQVAHPHIVNEAGRVIAAKHSCVVTQVFADDEMEDKRIEIEITQDTHHLVKNMAELENDLSLSNYLDVYYDALMIKQESIHAFKLGVLSLKEKAYLETSFQYICERILMMTKNLKYVPQEIKELETELTANRFVNLSIFQSAPDTWAINQMLPVLPLEGHHKKPDYYCRLADITCDSDGKFKEFPGPSGPRPYLPLHGKKEIIGIFLTGAYQDVMGDMHNLFGRLNEVHIFVDENDPDQYYIEEIIPGNRCADVLKIMQYNPKEMCAKIKKTVDCRIKSGDIPSRKGVELTDFYEKMIYSYTYLNID